MRYFKWVSATELDRWADSNDARSLLPRLVRLLVHATEEKGDLLHVNFPAEEETHRPGPDGETRTLQGNAWVPKGVPYWEMGANSGVTSKLNDDFQNRLEKRGEGDFKEVTYVAITPRDYQGKDLWRKEKENLGQWGEVRVYDSNDLEQWLEKAPAVGRWLSQFVAVSPEGLIDLYTRWENLQSSLLRPLPPSVVMIGRSSAVEKIREWLEASPQVLAVSGQSPQEVIDLFTAWVVSLPENEQESVASRTVIVEDAERLRELAESKERLILINGERLEAAPEQVSEAIRKGHHVLQPASSLRSVAGNVARLERIDRFELQRSLEQAGLKEQEAYVLSQQSGGSFTVLKRRFSSVPLISVPAWGKGQHAGELAPLLLAGSWLDRHQGDQAVVSKIAAQTYGEAQKIVTRWRTEADSPVRWVNGAWEFVSPFDAWVFLHSSLTPQYFDAFEGAAATVLGEDDPRLDLPLEERWLANVRGKQMLHSEYLRMGIARTMALLGSRSDVDVVDVCPLQLRVDRIVSAILPANCSWKRWASLGRLLPLLAEASPDYFLNSVESGLRGDGPEFVKLFQEEGPPTHGRAEHTGLLWGLQCVAWSSEFLPRATLALGRLAQLDPGGRWANRPKGSLREIFFSGMPQTATPVDQRVEAVRLREQNRRFPRKHGVLTWIEPGISFMIGA